MKRLFCFLCSLALASCDSLASPKLCAEIPEGGCPTGRGGSCQDASCKALYDCVDGVWKQASSCDSNSTSAGSTGSGTGGSTGSGVSSGSGGCVPIMLDHTGEIAGCKPDLQVPDCPAVAAEQCPKDACATGCTDFYICEKAGWKAVGYCDDKGNVVPQPR